MSSKPDRIDIAQYLHLQSLDGLGSKERILVAALKLFVDQGYFNTNIPDLSRESKCSVGSIYHHFRNKEEVAQSLYDSGIASFRIALEKAVEPGRAVSENLKSLVRSFLKFSEDNHLLSKYMWLSRHHEFMKGQIRHPTTIGFDHLGRVLTRALKNGIREGKIRPLKANVVWSIIFGIPLSYVRDWLDGYNAEPPSMFAEELVEACWRALKA